ncbi:hypothetical protein J1N09_01710 [Aureitalea sp. L0-47]|uniref:type VI secretion system transmembrane protein TssO n=1 Tax=Aureitalea sp. L0-47 TaxID=2816962 RepID=UPI002236F68D|nr:type VI secretion system transmembrane protein TssO [Aureitalea sp. L0-47]MCW5518537.1 hypothetical protein [Aureitalea sp. L0-47]
MRPKNSKERRSAFLKFLVLFLVTTSTVVAAVYFNFKIPNQENEILREDAKLVNADLKFQQGFYSEMKEIKELIDSLEIPGTIVDFESKQISSRLAVLSDKIPPNDSTNLSDMNMKIIELLLDLKNDKVKLHEVRNASSEIETLKESLQNCESSLSSANQTIAILRNN